MVPQAVLHGTGGPRGDCFHPCVPCALSKFQMGAICEPATKVTGKLQHVHSDTDCGNFKRERHPQTWMLQLRKELKSVLSRLEVLLCFGGDLARLQKSPEKHTKRPLS